MIRARKRQFETALRLSYSGYVALNWWYNHPSSGPNTIVPAEPEHPNMRAHDAQGIFDIGWGEDARIFLRKHPTEPAWCACFIRESSENPYVFSIGDEARHGV